uniref:Spermatogenesis associated 7 n=1 Tax=Neogobius melanostomus TaxID=47308 RepID=A0A8C6WEV5_9GOBI
MLSHYKKVYSAKDNDQLKRGRGGGGGGGGGLQNGVRPQSAHSLSQRSRASCSPAQSRLSLQYDGSPYQCSSHSMTSTPRPSTSFHPKSTVYPPFSGDLGQQSLQASLRQRSACSMGDHLLNYKSFQDPVQKTYSGDLLQKHARRFTEEKPFTPKTLRTDKSSYLSKYRYYRAPQNTSQDSGHKTLLKSASRRESTHAADERSQGFTTDRDLDRDLSQEDFSHAHRRKHRLTHKPFPRVSYEGTKSPLSNHMDAEEEELKYLEFITAVTDDILSRGFISDGVVDRVINRHIDMNRYHLDEGKMRHLLEVLRRDLKEPCNSPINTLNFEREESPPPNNLLQKDDSEETKGETGQSHSLSADSIDYGDPILTSTLTPESAKTFMVGPIDLNEDKGTISPQLSERDSFSEADIRGNGSDSTNQEDSSQWEESDRLEKELQDVGQR